MEQHARTPGDPGDSRLETEIARLLTVGNALSTGVLVAGLGLWIAVGPAGPASALLHLGLILLMGTPIARVVLSCLVSVQKRDWFLASATFAVLIVLAASMIAAWAAVPR
jgi:uncharacterized membrane protein